MKSFKIITAFLLVFTFSCQNDDDNSLKNSNSNNNPDVFIENFGNEITRNFLGSVIDQNENPIENVTITIGSKIAQTDANGVFIIRDANIYERFGYVKAEKVGYIHGSRSVVPTSGTTKITIMLLEDTVVGTTNSGIAETITLPNGASVALEGDYIKADGSTYSGSVNVIMHHLDPADENMANQMPGMLYAANANNEERMLQTFGMLAVELRGSGGEDLNLATGTTAEIKMPLDASLLANAPATIPLWYFDEATGYWKEEGQANLVGNEYVGTVSHFSFWNYDAQFPAVNLCITVSDENGNPLANEHVTLTHSNASYPYPTSSGYTNEDGIVCGLIPSNEVLEINTYSYSVCGLTSIYSASIGPYTTDDSTNITITNSADLISETVTGTFNDCDGNAVTDGYVQLGYGGQTFIDIVDNGDFEINLIRCSTDNTFSIRGTDYVNLQTTDSINYTFTTPLTNIGSITACNSVTEFVQFNIDDGAIDLIFLDNIYAAYGPTGSSVNFYVSAGNSSDLFQLLGVLPEPPTIGTYYSIGINDPNGTLGFQFSESSYISEVNNNIIFNLTAFGEVGDYIDINFSGDYEDNSGNPHIITGIIHVLRDN